MTHSNRILIVDDEVDVRNLVSDVLQDEGYTTILCANEQEAISSLKSATPDLVLLDLWINNDESAGIKILSKIKKISSAIPVILISGHGTIDVAVNAIQKGAFDFIEKPFVIDRLLLTCKRALEHSMLKTENQALRNKQTDISVLSVGSSTFAQSIMQTINKAAANNSRILLKSHVGMYTEAIALEIHNLSSRKDKYFIHYRCFTDDHQKLDEELFGTEKKYGLIEQANGGTLFLEDITELSLASQKKLLDFVQYGTYYAGERKIYSDVRLISSTNKNINQLISCNSFSHELYYRLNITEIDISNISSRRIDIPAIVEYYLSNADVFFGTSKKQLTAKASAVLQSYSWPGNIQQIKNTIENALINANSSDEIDISHLPSSLYDTPTTELNVMDMANFLMLPLKEAKEKFENEYLNAQIERFANNISKTASFIGMERSALHRKLKLLSDRQFNK